MDPQTPEETRDLVVPEDGGGRLDVWLAEAAGLSRTRAVQLVGEGRVRLNGSVPKKRDTVGPGDRVTLVLPAPIPSTMDAEAIPLDVVYEDGDLLVINKPAGLVVHPAAGHRGGTLVNALLHSVEDLSGIGGVLRPGIVHRLDKDTSGLMIVAKNDDSHRALAEAIKTRKVKRAYLAAIWGHLGREDATVDAPIARHQGQRKRMAVVPGGRNAVTHFRRLEQWRSADLVRAELETGRTHQIRVHLLHLGHPVVGDRTYAPPGVKGIAPADRLWARGLLERVPRQFLHAAELRFLHPRTGKEMNFTAPLPADLQEAAEWARKAAPELA